MVEITILGGGHMKHKHWDIERSSYHNRRKYTKDPNAQYTEQNICNRKITIEQKV